MEEDLFGISSICFLMNSWAYMLFISGVNSTAAFVKYCGKLGFSLIPS